VVTSAGSAAALDCCLHLVRRDHGADAAATVARSLVTAPHRSGGQAQFARTRPLHRIDGQLGELLDGAVADIRLVRGWPTWSRTPGSAAGRSNDTFATSWGQPRGHG